MKKREGLTKRKKVSFRATETETSSIDLLAELTNTNRSEVLRKLVPDLSGAKKLTASVGA